MHNAYQTQLARLGYISLLVGYARSIESELANEATEQDILKSTRRRATKISRPAMSRQGPYLQSPLITVRQSTLQVYVLFLTCQRQVVVLVILGRRFLETWLFVRRRRKSYTIIWCFCFLA